MEYPGAGRMACPGCARGRGPAGRRAAGLSTGAPLPVGPAGCYRGTLAFLAALPRGDPISRGATLRRRPRPESVAARALRFFPGAAGLGSPSVGG